MSRASDNEVAAAMPALLHLDDPTIPCPLRKAGGL